MQVVLQDSSTPSGACREQPNGKLQAHIASGIAARTALANQPIFD
jgi:hypothetical protein